VLDPEDKVSECVNFVSPTAQHAVQNFISLPTYGLIGSVIQSGLSWANANIWTVYLLDLFTTPPDPKQNATLNMLRMNTVFGNLADAMTDAIRMEVRGLGNRYVIPSFGVVHDVQRWHIMWFILLYPLAILV
jgi:hypothetical protein